MSNSSPSLQRVTVEKAHESDVVHQDSPWLNQETLNHSDPPLLPENFHPPTQPHPDREENCADDGGEDYGECGEADEGLVQDTSDIPSGTALQVDATITAAILSYPDVIAASPSGCPITLWGPCNRKKGKGKGILNFKKQRIIEEKMNYLMENLNPIPFIPIKIPDFAKHEKLLRKLGLWDFVHIDLDRNVRTDLIAQLIATYDQKARCSYVNGYRIQVCRPHLSRALKLDMKKKKKRNAGEMDLDVEHEPLSDESIGFISELISDWLLLHEDTWMMPKEVINWFNLIRDGNPEKVDWTSLFWFMVENEIKQGAQLRDCYYASHLQHLIKFQRKELFLTAKSNCEHAKEENLGVNKEEGVDVNIFGEKNNNLEEKDSLVEGPSTELMLGKASEQEGVKHVEMVDTVEKCDDTDGIEVKEAEEEEVAGERKGDQGQWPLNEKNGLKECFMRCGVAENAEAFGNFVQKEEDDIGEWERGEEEEEEEEEKDGDEEENKFGVFTNHADSLDGDGMTDNLLQTMEVNQMASNQRDQLRDQSSVDMRIDDTPPFFNNKGKRVLEHDDNQLLHHSNKGNKKLRIIHSWGNKHADIEMCIEQFRKAAEKTTMLYDAKTREFEQLSMHQQIMLSELHNRDSIINDLHKARYEEMQKKDELLFRLEREIYLMVSVLEGYRKSLKETQKAFAEYREKSQFIDEPTNNDVEPRDLMSRAGEIENLEKEQDCVIAEQKMKKVMESCDRHSSVRAEKVDILEEKLTGLEPGAKEPIEQTAAKVYESQTEQMVNALDPQSEEKMYEAEEQPSASQSKEKQAAAEELPFASQSEEREAVAEEPQLAPHSEEKQPEAEEDKL